MGDRAAHEAACGMRGSEIGDELAAAVSRR
jgi:hypothetical protein